MNSFMQNLETRDWIVRNICYTQQNIYWTIWIFYSFIQQVNDQSDQQCKILCEHTALCGVVEHWQ